MVHSDSPSGDESTLAEAAPTAAAFVDTIMERMAQQDAVQKATNDITQITLKSEFTLSNKRFNCST